jgi:hypothetical protein
VSYRNKEKLRAQIEGMGRLETVDKGLEGTRGGEEGERDVI